MRGCLATAATYIHSEYPTRFWVVRYHAADGHVDSFPIEIGLAPYRMVVSSGIR